MTHTVTVTYKPDKGAPAGETVSFPFTNHANANAFLERIRKNPDVQQAEKK